MTTMLEALAVADEERTQAEADAARWRMVEQALIDWRDATNYPASRTYGNEPSYAQAGARDRLTVAVDAALQTLKLEREVER